jgi:endonuclease/exonuclease/phosphatase family metal-dependent hydrolase
MKSRIGLFNPVLITADFNSTAGGEIHLMLTTGFEDAWVAAERRSGPEGTLNGFGKHTSSRRIDWIVYRAPWRVLGAATLSLTQDGAYPSDHFEIHAFIASLPE